MKQCPKCLGIKTVFDGEDFKKCNYCNGEGKVTDNKEQAYIPEDEISDFE